MSVSLTWRRHLRLAVGGYGGSCAGQDGCIAANAGYVAVLDWDGSAWAQRGSDIEGQQYGALFGRSVSLSDDGDVLAIGAYGHDNQFGNDGLAKVFVWDGVNWAQRGNGIDTIARTSAYSGMSVSLSDDGTVLAVGAPGGVGMGGDWAAVRTFAWDGSEYAQRGSDIDGEGFG